MLDAYILHGRYRPDSVVTLEDEAQCLVTDFIFRISVVVVVLIRAKIYDFLDDRGTGFNGRD